MNNKARIATVAAIALIASVPAAAAASSGDDQYCDPFGGCGGTTTTTPSTKPSTKPSHSGAGSGGSEQAQVSAAVQQQAMAQVVQAVKTLDQRKLERAVHSGNVDPGVAAKYRAMLRSKQAGAVLDAAGLSSLRATLASD